MGIIIVATLASQTALNVQAKLDAERTMRGQGALICLVDGSCVPDTFEVRGLMEHGAVETVAVVSHDIK